MSCFPLASGSAPHLLNKHHVGDLSCGVPKQVRHDISYNLAGCILN